MLVEAEGGGEDRRQLVLAAKRHVLNPDLQKFAETTQRRPESLAGGVPCTFYN